MREKIETVLSLAAAGLRTLKNNYYIIGSCALILSDASVEKTSDVDLVVTTADADQLKIIWAERMNENYKPARPDLFRSNFARFDFGELDIEVMGNLEVFKTNEWKPLQIHSYTEISVGDLKIKIPMLEEQKRIFVFLGREKDLAKAKLIENLL